VLGIEMPEALVACVEDIPIFRARYGVSRGNYALKVTEMLRHSDLTPRHKEFGVMP
jgi:flagellar motor switch protein FliM